MNGSMIGQYNSEDWSFDPSPHIASQASCKHTRPQPWGRGIFFQPLSMHTQPLSRHTGVFLQIQLCTHSHTRANQHFPSVPKTCVLPSCPARASLVPVFSFGENELFKQINNPEGSWLRMAQEKLKKSTGVPLPLCYARGIFQNNFGLVPYRKPIYTVGMYVK